MNKIKFFTNYTFTNQIERKTTSERISKIHKFDKNLYYGLDIENINDIVFKDTFEYLWAYHTKEMYTLVISEFQEYKTNYILKNITVYTTKGIFVFEPVFVD